MKRHLGRDMDLGLSEAQQMLKTSAREFLEAECPDTYVRAMEEDQKGYSPELWRKLAEQGWLGLIVPEKYGGAGLSFVDLSILLEETGRVLLPGPFFSTVVLAGMTVMDAATEAQKEEFLPGIAKGQIIATLALTEPTARWDPGGVQAVARRDGHNYVINGTKLFVPNAHVSDYMIVASRTGDGEKDITLFILPRETEGISQTLLKTVASDRQSEVLFDDVSVASSAVLGEINRGWDTIEKVLQWGAVGKCAEMVGGGQQVLDMTVEYAKQRVQFGRPIGSFQAIQHHCANMATDVEGSRYTLRTRLLGVCRKALRPRERWRWPRHGSATPTGAYAPWAISAMAPSASPKSTECNSTPAGRRPPSLPSAIAISTWRPWPGRWVRDTSGSLRGRYDLFRILAALSHALVDQRVRLECSPGEPEVVAMDDRGELLPAQRALNGLPQDIPHATGFVIYEIVTVGPECQKLALHAGVEHPCRPYIARSPDGPLVESRGGPGLEEYNQVLAVYVIVDHPFLFQNRNGKAASTRRCSRLPPVPWGAGAHRGCHRTGNVGRRRDHSLRRGSRRRDGRTLSPEKGPFLWIRSFEVLIRDDGSRKDFESPARQCPDDALAGHCCHHDSVWRSHMMRSLLRSFPETPKS